MKYDVTGKVLHQERIGTGIYDLTIHAPEIAKEAAAGQFVSVFTKDNSRLLPRPISLCGFDKEKGTLRLVYRVTGKNTGTEEFSRLTEGEDIRVMGPLGNGFPLKEAQGKRIVLFGGGIGIPPMLETAKQLTADVTAVLGFRDELFLNNEFENYGKVFIATEDGSCGTKGNVLDAVNEQKISADIIFACGPTPMLRAISAYAKQKGITCYISMEERMACGIGACLGCVCKSKDVDEHSHVHNKRVCKDGPVFLSTEVEL